MYLMRTTLDIPEDLLRRAKAEAALRGLTLKAYVTEALGAALGDAHVAETAPSYAAEDRQVVGEGCEFPVIRGRGGPVLRDLTPERVHEILEQEEVERALPRAIDDPR